MCTKLSYLRPVFSSRANDFLVYLAHALTILARDTYEVGTEGVTNPSRLRHINELQHRS